MFKKRVILYKLLCYMSICKNQTKQEKVKARNEKMRERFYHLTEVKHYNSDHALNLLEEEYLPLERETIWLIIRQTGYYKNL